MLVSEENGGLTSALEWLVAAKAEAEGTVIPLVIDFLALRPGPDALAAEIRKQLNLAEITIGKTDALPRVAVSIDNVSTKPAKKFAHLIGDLQNSGFALAVVGCRLGAEPDVIAALSAGGATVSTRYLGALNHADATQFASLVDSTRSSTLAERALQIVQREHLPRTPFTLGLLISALLNGESLLGAASETSLLDAYVNLMLGRGDRTTTRDSQSTRGSGQHLGTHRRVVRERAHGVPARCRRAAIFG